MNNNKMMLGSGLGSLVLMALAYAVQLCPSGTLGPSLGFTIGYALIASVIPGLAVMADRSSRETSRKVRPRARPAGAAC